MTDRVSLIRRSKKGDETWDGSVNDSRTMVEIRTCKPGGRPKVQTFPVVGRDPQATLDALVQNQISLGWELPTVAIQAATDSTSAAKADDESDSAIPERLGSYLTIAIQPKHRNAVTKQVSSLAAMLGLTFSGSAVTGASSQDKLDMDKIWSGTASDQSNMAVLFAALGFKFEIPIRNELNDTVDVRAILKALPDELRTNLEDVGFAPRALRFVLRDEPAREYTLAI